MSRIPELDGVRGAAAFGIVLWHYVPSIVIAGPGTPLAYLSRALSLCWTGVDLFFVLSGFLIGSILRRERGATNYFSAFYVRRAARIVPLYVVLLLGLAAGAAWVRGGAPSFVKPMFEVTLPWWSFLVFAQNFFMPGIDDFGPKLLSATWSLAVEEQFYLLLPLLIFFLRRQTLIWFVGALFVVAPLLRHAIPTGMATYVLLPFRLDSLMAGVLLALAWESAVWRQRLTRNSRWLAAGWLGFAVYAMVLLKGGAGIWALGLPWGWLLNTGMAIWFTVTLALLLAGPSQLGAPFRWAPLQWAGRIAYGLYLLHGPSLYLCHYAVLGAAPELKNVPTAAVTTAALGVSILVSLAAYRWIEAPCLKLGHHFKYHREKK